MRIFARVVLEIGVLDDHDVACRFTNPACHGRSLAAVLRLQQHADAVPAIEIFQDVPCPIARAIVHDHDLFFDVRKLDGQDAGDDLPNGAPLVVAGHHD